MSAPQTNIEKQKRWHRGPLIGMALATIFGVGMIVIWLMDEAENAGNPDTVLQAPGDTAPVEPMPKADPAPAG